MSKILLIGAGAVGQAYGFHLSRGGADVTYFVREKYVAELSGGLRVECLSGSQKGKHEFHDFKTVTRMLDVRGEPWDEVWLCVSSPALYGDWFMELVESIGHATLVMLQPGMDDYDYVTERVSAERVVHGMITLASFQEPLSNDEETRMMKWWFPPLSSALFTGEQSRVSPIVDYLKRGGMPAKRVTDVQERIGVGSGILMPLIAALEMDNWSLRTLRCGNNLAKAAEVARVATEISQPGKRRVLVWLVTRHWVLRIGIWLAPIFAPFDLQAMLRSHFSKVGLQTRRMLSDYLKKAKARGLPFEALETFNQALEIHE